MMKYQELMPALTWGKNNLACRAKHPPKHKAPWLINDPELPHGA